MAELSVKAIKTNKRFKAEKVEDSDVEAIAMEMLDGIEQLSKNPGWFIQL